MQLFTHLLSSYLQGMGDFFSALPWGGMGRGTYGLPPLGEGWGGAPMNSRPLGGPGRGLWCRGGAFTYNLSHTRRKPQHVAMSGRHWLRVITPLSESELLWFPPRLTLLRPVCGPLGLV